MERGLECKSTLENTFASIVISPILGRLNRSNRFLGVAFACYFHHSAVIDKHQRCCSVKS